MRVRRILNVVGAVAVLAMAQSSMAADAENPGSWIYTGTFMEIFTKPTRQAILEERTGLMSIRRR